MTTTEAPSCPRCALNDRVVGLERPTVHGKLVDLPNGWQFDCARCNLVFTGTDGEWARMTEDRKKLRDQAAKRAAFDRAQAVAS